MISSSGLRQSSLNISRNKPAKASLLSIQSLLTHGVFGLICFYLGLLVAVSGKSNCVSINSQQQDQLTAAVLSKAQCPPCPKESSTSTIKSSKSSSTMKNGTFPSTLSNMFVDFKTVNRVDLNDVLEIGVPLDDTKAGAEDALILYTSPKSQPTSKSSPLSAADALENCRTVKVLLVETAKQHAVPECLAILPQWESYYVHKFMRLPPNSGGIDPKAPLRYVSRSHDIKGQMSNVPDYKRHTKPSYDALVEYLQNLDDLLTDLKPLLESLLKESTNPSSQSIIVQVCNYGQVELFHNYLCNAKAKGLDYSHIFLFATDEKTYQLCQDLGIPAYYNQAIFGDMPEAAARGYGDRIFSKMMMAKVYCVHLVLSCGYNVLFQDVDVVWYQNPLPYLESPSLSEWDLMFQDDGARSVRYAPYSPNTGFYFVRYSAETLFFFGMLLRSGDVIGKTTSHQAALTALLNEHVSWKGLRVKVWKKGETNPFPGGVEYHRQKDMMKRLLTHNKAEIEERKASNGAASTNTTNLYYLFHMSWTKNKDNKKLYFQQMGEWYLKSDCLTGWDCCLAEPEITCHYRDKPSMIPCKDSPPIDAGRPSFW